MYLKSVVDGQVIHLKIIKETPNQYVTNEAYTFGIFSINFKMRQSKTVRWNKHSRQLLNSYRTDVVFGKKVSSLPDDYDGLVY